jgi:hypothetical protein
MAIFYECDWCGRAIHADDWLDLRTADRSPRLDADALDRMGLPRARDAVETRLHFHADCFEETLRLLEDHRRWTDQIDHAPTDDDLPRWQLKPPRRSRTRKASPKPAR